MNKLSLVFLTLIIFSSLGCYNSYQSERDDYLYKLDNATDLVDFLKIQQNNNKLGIYAIDESLISQKRRQWYVENIPYISDGDRELILGGKWKIGMHKVDIYASIGLPNDVNRTVINDKVLEQWVYEYDSTVPINSRTYLYFENDILTSWQD